MNHMNRKATIAQGPEPEAGFPASITFRFRTKQQIEAETKRVFS
jgi:hypothetical protein